MSFTHVTDVIYMRTLKRIISTLALSFEDAKWLSRGHLESENVTSYAGIWCINILVAKLFFCAIYIRMSNLKKNNSLYDIIWLCTFINCLWFQAYRYQNKQQWMSKQIGRIHYISYPHQYHGRNISWQPWHKRPPNCKATNSSKLFQQLEIKHLFT